MKEPIDISDFDNLMRDAFEGAGVEPPPGVWEAVSSQITAGVGTTIGVAAKTVLLKTIAAKILTAVLVTGIIGTTTYVLIDSAKDKSDKTEVVSEKGNTTIDQKKESASLNELNDNRISEITTIENGEPINSLESGKTNSMEDKLNSLIRAEQSQESSNPLDPNYKDLNRGSKNPVEIIPGNSFPQNILNILLFDSVFCPGQDIEVSSTSKQYFSKLVWDNGNGKLIENKEKISVNYPKKGVYVLKLFGYQNQTAYVVKKNIYIKTNQVDFDWKETIDGEIHCSTRDIFGSNYQWSIAGKTVKEGSESTFDITRETVGTAGKLTIGLTVTDEGGCQAKISKTILPTVSAKDEVNIPNIFTPWEIDNVNDCYKIEIENPLLFSITIRNRKGDIVFSSNKADECWNGKSQNTGNTCEKGVYYYFFNYQLIGSEVRSKTGKIYLN